MIISCPLHRCRLLTVALFLGLQSLPDLQAQNAFLNTQTLQEVVIEALEKNPELNYYEAEIAAAKGGRKMAAQLSNPEISGSLGQKRNSGRGLGAEGMAWSVSVMQPFEWPGRISLRKAVANHDIDLAQLGYDRFKSALSGRIKRLAYGLFAAQEKSAAASEVADRFRSLREVLVQRDPAGLTPLLETRVIEATELNAQRKASDALLSIQSTMLELNQLRGVALEAHFTISQAELTFDFVLPDRNSLIALARTNNFELRARVVELGQQGFRVGLARSERFPTLSVGPTYSEEKVGSDRERIIGLGISLPLPLWNRNKGNIDVALARQTQAEISLNLAERDLQRKVFEAALTLETKLREMGKWRSDSVKHFKEAAEVADRHYRLGAVPISTYVELQKQYLDAVEGLLDTKKEALAAAAELELLTGISLPVVKTSASANSK